MSLATPLDVLHNNQSHRHFDMDYLTAPIIGCFSVVLFQIFVLVNNANHDLSRL